VRIVAFAALALVWMASVLFRLDELTLQSGAPSLEATYHAAWTMKVLSEAPIASHALLPSVVLDPLVGDTLLWGATPPTKGGGLIYTSFPPAGFVGPLAALSIFGVQVSASSLIVFNALLGLATAFVMLFLMREVMRLIPSKDRVPFAGTWMVSSLLAGCYLWSSEALLTHGAVYWAHSVSQVFFVGACLMFLRHQAFGLRPLSIFGIAVLCGGFALLEWTGYVFNAGLTSILIIQAFRSEGAKRKEHLLLAVSIAGATLLVLIGTVIHYASMIGFEAMFETSLSRAERRSGFSDPMGSLSALPNAYLVSFGLLVPLAIFAVFKLYKTGHLIGPVGLVILAAFLPMLENLVLMDHALSYSFDRLKLSVPLLMALAAWIACLSGRRALQVSVFCVAAIGLSGAVIYEFRTLPYSAWRDVQYQNDTRVLDISSDPLADCAVYGHARSTRGYLNLLLDRDVYERSSLQEMVLAAQVKQACAIVYMETSAPYRDITLIDKFSVYDPEGNLLRSGN